MDTYVEQRVRDEVTRLRRSDPNAKGRDLRWKAEGTVQRQIAAEVEAGELVPRRTRTGLIGLGLVCVATPMAVASLVLTSQEGRITDGAFRLWVAASLLGTIGLGFVIAAAGRIRQSLGLVTGRGLVTVGFTLAALGATASFLFMLFGAISNSGM